MKTEGHWTTLLTVTVHVWRLRVVIWFLLPLRDCEKINWQIPLIACARVYTKYTIPTIYRAPLPVLFINCWAPKTNECECRSSNSFVALVCHLIAGQQSVPTWTRVRGHSIEDAICVKYYACCAHKLGRKENVPRRFNVNCLRQKQRHSLRLYLTLTRILILTLTLSQGQNTK